MMPLPTFSNPMDAAGGDEVKKFKLDDETGGTFEFQFNPTSFSLDRSVSWDDAKAMKEPYGILNFTGGQSDTVDFQTLFDGTETEVKVLDEVKKLYALTKTSVEENNYKRPPIVKLTWTDLTFVGVIASIKVDFTMFTAEGVPVRADVTVSMTGRAFSTKDGESDFFAPFSG